MARKSLKSSKARTTEQRHEDKAARTTKPWRITGSAFCLGAIVMAVAFVLTPLGAWCVTHYEPMVISVTKCDHKPQGAGRNKGSCPPDPEELARLAQRRAAQNRRGKKAEKKKDPLAELRRIEAINARNRALLNRHAVHRPGSTASHVHPHQPTTHQPPGVPKPVIPAYNPTAAHLPRQ